MQQRGKYYTFILLFAISCRVAEIKVCSNLPEVIHESLVYKGFCFFFQGFSKCF